MKNFLSLLGFLFILGIAGQVSAASITLIDDGFESGNLTDWDFANATIEKDSSYQNWGEYYAQIKDTSWDGSSESYSGFIKQTISYNDGDTYSFDWLLLFPDGDPDDYAYYKIGGVEEVFYTKELGPNPSVDWTTETITFSGTGTGVDFEIGVVSYKENYYSQLLIDANPVPEPATLLLLGIGLLSITGIRRKS